MKNILKKIIINILTLQSRIVLKKYNPKIIAITGSVGKTSTKDAVFTILSKFKTVRKSEKSFNSEIGLPLTILGLPNGWSSMHIWLENIIRGFILIFIRKPYPEYLVLEVGVGKPGDIIKNVAPWLKPDIVIITRFPDKPVHIEFFGSVEKIIKEKSALAYTLNPNGLLILNHDDEKVYDLHNKSICRTISFGKNENSTFTIVNPIYIMKEMGDMSIIGGINFKLKYNGNTFPVTLNKVISLHDIYSALAAIACACEVGCDLLDSIKQISDYTTPPGRLSLLPGINNSILIDDTYNSSPVAVMSAIEVIEVMKGKRKIAILGDMLELGKYTESEHRTIGERIIPVFDVLVTVGPRAKYIAESSLENGFNKRNIYNFDNSISAGEFLKTFIKEGDICLFKGSQGIRLERAVVAVMAHPELKMKLVCRQEKEWQNR